MSSNKYSAYKKLHKNYWYRSSHVISVDRNRWVLVYPSIRQILLTRLQILVVSFTIKTLDICLRNLLRIYADFSHTLLAALFELWNLWALIPDIRHPTPPFLGKFLEHDHLSDFLFNNLLSSCSLLCFISVTAILLSEVTVFLDTKWTIFDLIYQFEIDQGTDFLVKLLEVID